MADMKIRPKSISYDHLSDSLRTLINNLRDRVGAGANSPPSPLLRSAAGATEGDIQTRSASGLLSFVPGFRIVNNILNAIRAKFDLTGSVHSVSDSAVYAEAPSGTGVYAKGKRALYVQGEYVLTELAGAEVYGSTVELSSTQSYSWTGKIRNVSDAANVGIGIYAEGNAHADARGVDTRGLLVSGKPANLDCDLYTDEQIFNLSVGNNNNVALPSGCYTCLISSALAGAATITGFAKQSNGNWSQHKTVIYRGSQVITIAHDSGSSSSGNRILCPNNAAIVSRGAFVMELRWSLIASAWIIVSFIPMTQVWTIATTSIAGTFAATWTAANQTLANSVVAQFNALRADVINLQTILKERGDVR